MKTRVKTFLRDAINRLRCLKQILFNRYFIAIKLNIKDETISVTHFNVDLFRVLCIIAKDLQEPSKDEPENNETALKYFVNSIALYKENNGQRELTAIKLSDFEKLKELYSNIKF